MCMTQTLLKLLKGFNVVKFQQLGGGGGSRLA